MLNAPDTLRAEEQFRKARIITVPTQIKRKQASKLTKLKTILKNWHNTELKAIALEMMSNSCFYSHYAKINNFIKGKDIKCTDAERELLEEYKESLFINRQIKEDKAPVKQSKGKVLYAIVDKDEILMTNTERLYVEGYLAHLTKTATKKYRLAEITINYLEATNG